jgi:hypothetical protein
MFPSLDAPLPELEASEAIWEAMIFWGTISLGVIIGIGAPIVSWRRTVVAQRIAELKSTEATVAAEEKADAKHKEVLGKNEQLQESLTEARAQIAEMQRQRRLTPEQKRAIKEAIAPFAGQKVVVEYPMNDAEASQYAGDFAAAFREAGWDCKGVQGGFFPYDFANTVPVASKKEPQDSKGGMIPPKAFYPLVRVLMDLKLSDNRGMDPAKQANQIDGIAPGEIGLRVSAKMPPGDPPSALDR